MSQAAALRIQIESALAKRIPLALTPQPHAVRPVVSTGIAALDDLLGGGLPVGAISEIVGPECSGRTTLAMNYLAGVVAADQVCAWIDVADTFSPESAAAAGVDLSSLLWVRCGESTGKAATARVPAATMPLNMPDGPVMPTRSTQGGGCGSPHPRGEVRGLDTAIEDLMRRKDNFVRDKSIGTPAVRNLPLTLAHRSAVAGSSTKRVREEQIATDRLPSRRGEAVLRQGQPYASACAEPQVHARVHKKFSGPGSIVRMKSIQPKAHEKKPWSRLDQALRATDLLLQAGGFAAIVLDLGSIAREHALQVPLATWFRYRAAVEKARTSLVLLSREACAKSSAGVVLRMDAVETLQANSRVFSGLSFRSELLRQRFTATSVSNVVPMRKPPRRESRTEWASATAWTARGGA